MHYYSYPYSYYPIYKNKSSYKNKFRNNFVYLQ